MADKENELVDATKMASILNITEEGLRQRIYRDKNIPHYKIGGVLRFYEHEVLNYFKRGKDF